MPLAGPEKPHRSPHISARCQPLHLLNSPLTAIYFEPQTPATLHALCSHVCSLCRFCCVQDLSHFWYFSPLLIPQISQDTKPSQESSPTCYLRFPLAFSARSIIVVPNHACTSKISCDYLNP